MKKTFTFLLFAFVTCAAFAGPDDGRISVTHLGMRIIRVEVDGKMFGNNDRSITISNLAPGNHVIKVFIETGTGGVQQRTPVYFTTIRIKPKFHVDIVINRFGKPLIDELFMDMRYGQGSYYDDDYVYDRPDRPDRPDMPSRPDRDPRYDDNRPRAMNDASFASLVETMKKESFESTRLDMTKQVVDKNYFTTSQVKQLLLMYSFDGNRLDLAKYAYRNTLDRENYFQLYDVLTFSRSKEELAAYIKNYK
jgi:hypothetical protein